MTTSILNKWLVMWVLFGALAFIFKDMPGMTSEFVGVVLIEILLSYIMFRRFMRFATGR